MTLRSSLWLLRMLGVSAPLSILLSTARAQQPTRSTPAVPRLVATPVVGWNPAYIYGEDISDSLSAQFDHLDATLPALADLLTQCRQRGISTDYEQIDYTTISNFIPWGRDHLAHGDVARADSIAVALDALSREATIQLQAYLRGEVHPRAVPRYVTQRPKIIGTSFLGDMRWPNGHIEHHRPIFFTGYGFFGQVRKDIPRFPSYGANIIQIEIGPSAVIFPSTHPGRPFDDSTTAITNDIRRALDSAAKYNVALNLLLSPHYFPDWALAQWPETRNDNGDGFISFNIVAPRAKIVIKSYLQTIIPLIKDAPALHSVTLSNEPRYDAKGDSADQQAWHEYLTHLYGSIQRCNTVYGTQYTDFTKVSIPRTAAPTPIYYDWMTFKDARFAAWHAWMAGIIHEIAPRLPLHVKILSWTVDDMTAGIDPERFTQFSQISGNDNWTETGFLTYERFYDLLGSLKTAPIFDSEAHLEPGDAAHARLAMWQGAIHGRTAATLWVWERPDLKSLDYDYTLLTRPDIVAAVGRTTLDLNRLAREVTALQTAPTPVALLYVRPSKLYAPNYDALLARAYTALTLSGQKVAFVTETQVAAGQLSRYKLLVIPGATHVHAPTVRGIGHFAEAGGHVVAIDTQVLTRDEHNQPLPNDGRRRALAHAVTLETTAPDSTVRAVLLRQLHRLGLTRVQLMDAATHQPVDYTTAGGKGLFGCEWRSVMYHGKRLVNLVAYGEGDRSVYLEIDGRKIDRATDLISGTSMGGPIFHVHSGTPYLLELSSPGR